MKSYKILFFSGLLLLFFMLLTRNAYSQAAPMPPRFVINYQQRQCAQIVPGDECGDVILPPDWEYLNANSGEQCPAEYTFVDLSPDWIHFKASFCCTVGHSGSSGDCEDMLINQSNHQCAFVEDINSCAILPLGWELSAENCPPEFGWTEDIICLNEETSTPTRSALSASGEMGPAEQVESTPPPVQTVQPTPPGQSSPILPCGSLGLLLVALFILRFL